MIVEILHNNHDLALSNYFYQVILNRVDFRGIIGDGASKDRTGGGEGLICKHRRLNTEESLIFIKPQIMSLVFFN